ncbi:hypothetical protein J2848_006829 [Azospirillum lipoferum]|uniref:Hemerythrin domain-containing protein n=1 Tax=Azospirillum lipoferum TaxID=193 RepID=A0A5A9FYC8_AZOLI|nr:MULTISPECIES: hemerythrin domain-containing protein [Azospirillum]KAA0587188.1 hemerythrin domain-containing protein [Azospirillum lipoferum]MCP1615116.1 hypothetical protein [Azospirillum lipoferum]MDW5533013.1 hemerythrin domain-containing protein [Azospirillum sp. NL1]
MTKIALNTALYRDHHANVGQLVGRIEALLASRSVETDPAALIATVRELFGIFAVHLSLEDSALYPRLLAHPDAALRGTAARFQAEMGNLRARFDQYRTRVSGHSVRQSMAGRVTDRAGAVPRAGVDQATSHTHRFLTVLCNRRRSIHDEPSSPCLLVCPWRSATG